LAKTKKTTAKTSTKTAAKTATKAAAKTTAKTTAKTPAKSTAKSATKATTKAKATMDRRASSKERREPIKERRTKSEPIPVERREGERREKVARRRQIDPTTCERDYGDHEVEFMQALDAYKRASGRMFPTCSEILEVVKGLGYVQTSSGGLSPEEVGEKVATADKANSA
jgi:hypothetical protein